MQTVRINQLVCMRSVLLCAYNPFFEKLSRVCGVFCDQDIYLSYKSIANAPTLV